MSKKSKIVLAVICYYGVVAVIIAVARDFALKASYLNPNYNYNMSPDDIKGLYAALAIILPFVVPMVVTIIWSIINHWGEESCSIETPDVFEHNPGNSDCYDFTLDIACSNIPGNAYYHGDD